MVREYETKQGARRVVSMKSGLGDRNNRDQPTADSPRQEIVSMKSGLGDRNNFPSNPAGWKPRRLNEVRSWRPEQFSVYGGLFIGVFWLSPANALSEGDVGAACPI